MSNLVVSQSEVGATIADRLAMRATARGIALVQHRTTVRAAQVQGEGIVQGLKLREIDHLTRQAMSGQALLRNWADTLGRNDPFLADELRFFTDLARLGKGEVIADTIGSYTSESRS